MRLHVAAHLNARKPTMKPRRWMKALEKTNLEALFLYSLRDQGKSQVASSLGLSVICIRTISQSVMSEHT